MWCRRLKPARPSISIKGLYWVREELRRLLENLSITARTIVVGGDPAKAVSEIARSEEVAQLVIARGAVAAGL